MIQHLERQDAIAANMHVDARKSTRNRS